MPRTVLLPENIGPDSLLGAGSGLTVRILTGETMGTYWKLSFQNTPSISERIIRDSLEDTFSSIIAQMSHWDESSELSRFNCLTAGEEMQISPDFFHTLSQALQISALTEGAFDPTIGHIVNQLGFGPDSKKTNKAKNASTWQDITLNSKTQTASHAGNCTLDLSSIAKGTAVDKASLVLENLGIKNYLLEIGGELRGAGCKPDGQPWWTVIDPLCEHTNNTKSQTVVALSGISIATSGTAIHSRKEGQKNIHHLIDPSTCHSAQNNLIAVTVISEECILADAWATALFILGLEKALPLATAQNLAASFHYRENNSTKELTTPKWQEMAAD